MRRHALLLLVVACAHRAPESAGEVTVKFERLEAQHPNFDGATVVLTWRIENPTSEAVTLKDWEEQLWLEGRQLEGLEHAAELTVPPRETTTMSLAIGLDYDKLFAGRRPSWPKLVAIVNPKGGGRAYPVKHEAMYSMPGMPQLSLRALHVERSPETLGVTLTVGFSNPNDFPVVLEQLNADVLIAGQSIGSLPAEVLRFPPKGSHQIVFQRSVGSLSLGGLARSALYSTEAVSADVKGSAVVEGRPMTVATGGMIRPR